MNTAVLSRLFPFVLPKVTGLDSTLCIQVIFMKKPTHALINYIRCLLATPTYFGRLLRPSSEEDKYFMNSDLGLIRHTQHFIVLYTLKMVAEGDRNIQVWSINNHKCICWFFFIKITWGIRRFFPDKRFQNLVRKRLAAFLPKYGSFGKDISCHCRESNQELGVVDCTCVQEQVLGWEIIRQMCKQCNSLQVQYIH
jgi:hypothetical protein